MLGAEDVVRPYSGAVCQYVLERGSGPMSAPLRLRRRSTSSSPGSRPAASSVNGTLADERGAKVTDMVVERHHAFLARRDTNGAGCSATAAAGPGRAELVGAVRAVKANADPCADAEKLLAATLSSEM